MSLSHRSRGFTLVELVVVMSLLALLLAIGVPQLLNRANNVDEQRTIRQLTEAVEAVRGHHLALRQLPGVEQLADLAPGPTYTTAAASPNHISYAATTSTAAFAAVSGSGTCFLYRIDFAAGTDESGTFDTTAQPELECSAATALTHIEEFEEWR